MTETLRQIATTPGGTVAGNLVSKAQKEEASDLGFVWPKYGGTFRLTPAGAAYCRENGVEPAPFAVIPAAELHKLVFSADMDEYDRKKLNAWIRLAIPGYNPGDYLDQDLGADR